MRIKRLVGNIARVITMILVMLTFQNCSSNGGGGDTGSETSTPTTTTINHYSVYFNSCEVPCSVFSLYKYSVDDQSISIIGDGYYDEVDYGFEKDSPVLLEMAGKIYFSASDITNGFELWVYDPNQPEVMGTNPKVLADLNSGTADSSPYAFTVAAGKLYFSAITATTGRELFVYDPNEVVSASNPQIIMDINAGSTSSIIYPMIALDDKLYFRSSTSITGQELWTYDPALAISGSNPQMIIDYYPGSTSSNPSHLIAFAGKLHYRATSSSLGTEIHVYDPTIATSGTNPQVLTDLFPGSSGSAPSFFSTHEGLLYFKARDNTNGYELWSYDPSQAIQMGTNPKITYDFYSGIGNSNPRFITSLNSKIYYTARTTTNGYELITYDPNEPIILGTNPSVADLISGAAGSSPSNLNAAGDLLVFSSETASGAFKFSLLDSTQPTIVGVNPTFHAIDFVDEIYDIHVHLEVETITE